MLQYHYRKEQILYFFSCNKKKLEKSAKVGLLILWFNCIIKAHFIVSGNDIAICALGSSFVLYYQIRLMVAP